MPDSDPNSSALAVPTKEGIKPDSRIKTCHQVWEICSGLEKADSKRAKKRTRIFKAYNRFPPSEYSLLYKQGADWQSNVPFGMMSYVIDNNLSSFFDMLTERPWAAKISTKLGTLREQEEWSNHLSFAFDRMLMEWDDFMSNNEQDLLDMLLYGKGVQMKEEEEGFLTEHLSVDDLLAPDGLMLNFKNFDVLAVKRPYSLHTLWEKLESGGAEARGWKRKAVLEAMWYQREEWQKKYKTSEDWSHAVAEGDITLSAHLKEQVQTYMLFAREFGTGGKCGKISKFIVLRDYGPAFSLMRQNRGVVNTEEAKKAIVNQKGFLFSKLNCVDKITDIFSVFIDKSGSGQWHNTPSLAETIFVQCRQYDFTMNAIMDAVKINMSLMLQASTPEASDKIKALVFGPHVIIPSDVPFVQKQLALPTGEATQAVQFMMLDMFRGIGEYRVNERTQTGQPVTATQNQNDTAEAAKLSGTQLKRFNGQHTFYYRRLVRDMLTLKLGEKDQEHYDRFKEYLDEQGVPPDAYKWENIRSIESNMLSGAGSPSYKLMAAEKTIALTNVSPNGEGQANAIDDALAALHGRSNVRRYSVRVKPDKTFNQLKAGWENNMLSNPFCDPRSVQVMPDDDHMYHMNDHMGDMERTILLVNEKMKAGPISPFLAESAAFKLLNLGGHTNAHMQMLSRDGGKQEQLKMGSVRLNDIQKGADDLAKKMQSAKDQQTEDFDPSKDPDVAKKIAMGQLEISTKQKLADIKIGAIATGHAQRQQIQEDKAAADIAIQRAKESDKIVTKRKLEAAEA